MTGESEDPGIPARVYRTVTPPYRSRPDAEMTAIGFAYFLGLVILLIPLLPFIVIIWVLSKVFDALANR